MRVKRIAYAYEYGRLIKHVAGRFLPEIIGGAIALSIIASGRCA